MTDWVPKLSILAPPLLEPFRSSFGVNRVRGRTVNQKEKSCNRFLSPNKVTQCCLAIISNT